MRFNLLALILTIGCCLVTIIIAAKSGNDGDKEWFKNLNHPDNAFMVKFLDKFGIIVFLLFGFTLYHLFIRNDIVPIVVMILVMLMMGLSPMLLYKARNLKLFFISNLILFIFLPMLIYYLWQSNITLAILVTIYQLWVIYEMTYWYRLMKLNK